MTKQKQTERDESIKELRRILRPGDTVYGIVRHVSSSGMTRRIDFYTIKKSQPRCITWDMAVVLGYLRHKHGGLNVVGCGMDMIFSCVYNLGSTLWPKGFKLRKGQYGRNGDTSGFDSDGGYALKHNSL